MNKALRLAAILVPVLFVAALLSAQQANFPAGSGTIKSGTQGQVAVYSANGTSVGSSAATLDATQFAGADMSLKITAAMEAAYASSTISANINADGFAGAQEWTVNPWRAASDAGMLPSSGTLHVCEKGEISVDVPLIRANNWNLVDDCFSASGFPPSVASFQASATKFPTTYATGTVTVGTDGYEDTITGSGTTWTSNMIGCELIAPATNPTAANSTWGFVHTVSSATSIILGWGHNNGTGAPAASAYKITNCPVMATGDGHLSAGGGGPYEAGMWTSGVAISCNNIAGCVDLVNDYGNELTGGDHLSLIGFTNIGFLNEGGFVQNDGPWGPGIAAPGSMCTAATIPIVERSFYTVRRPLDGWTTGGCSGQQVAIAIDDEASYMPIQNIHIGGAVLGIEVGGNVSCPILCAIPPKSTTNALITNIQAESPGTTVVHFSNAFGPVYGGVVLDISYQSGWTNTFADDNTSCTEPNTQLGYYLVDSYGNVGAGASQVTNCETNGNYNSLNVKNSLSSGSFEDFGTTILAAKLQQSGTGKFAGHCSMSTSTTCTFSLSGGTFTTAACIASLQGTGTVIAGECSVSTSTVTITAASSNSGTWSAIVVGDPN